MGRNQESRAEGIAARERNKLVVPEKPHIIMILMDY